MSQRPYKLENWYATPRKRKTYKLIPPIPLTEEQRTTPFSRRGIVFWGVHRKFGPWVILPSYLTIDHVIRTKGTDSLIEDKPVQVKDKHTGMRYTIVRRTDLRNTLLQSSRMFTLNPAVLLKIVKALQPAVIPMTFRFDAREVRNSLERTHLKEKQLLRRLFTGTQQLDKVMHNINTYSLTRPDQDGLFMQWIGPLLHKSILHATY